MQGEVKGGRYEIQETIGRGGMGVVYRARDSRLKRTVALKMLPPEVSDDPELLRRLSQEARAASAISHPGVATVFDFEEHAGESFIVYEYVEGETLTARLKRRRLTSEEVLEIGIQMADALAAAHDRGVVHRDLKPDNVMLVATAGGPARIKILDFGLAKLRQPLRSVSQTGSGETEATALTTPGLMIGTVNYMAPEQLAGEPADARTDLHGLGMVIYEMAAGINPYLGSTSASTIANIMTREPARLGERNPVAPAELDRILRKCLRKRRDERYPSARDLMVDLSNLRRDLSLPGDLPERAGLAAAPEAPLSISRAWARGLFMFIQLGYLAMYGVAFSYLPSIQDLPMPYPGWTVAMLVAFSALCGAVVRIYFLSAVGFDWVDAGRLFRRLFVAILTLDVIWSLSPLLLFHKLGFIILLCMAGLAFLPFSQRALLYSAYAPGGGHTSGARPVSSA
ncbi:MAG: serine/threonine protein kinase [Acidobacteria bacterium]|nr:serine/threonine protein kinase [Acidobacteriota bacterium]